MRRKVALFSIILLLVALGVGQLPAARATVPGGVFVTGHDPDYHAYRGANAVGARHIIQKAIQYVTYNKANPSILLVTDLRNPGGDQSDPRLGMTAAGYTYALADHGSGAPGVFDLHTVNFYDYDVIVVASDYGGWLRQEQLDLLNARSADLIDYVNAGGGIVAFSEAGNRGGGAGVYHGTTLDRFGFLPFLVSETPLSQTEIGNTVTPEGAAMGLTNADVNNNASHSVFTATGGMDVIDTDSAGRILSLATRGHFITGGNCSAAPSVGWTAPLSDTTTISHPVGSPLEIKFRYGTCVNFMHDESVVILVADSAFPDYPVAAFVYGYDITIDDAAQTYRQVFNPSHYGLAPGTDVAVQIYIGESLVSTAHVLLTP